MVANIKETDGIAFGAYARKPAWHTLGTVTEDAKTASEALAIAHLNGWDVRKEPIYTEAGLMVPDRYATVMTDPVDGQDRVLGDVGGRYVVFQNEEHAEFLDTLVGEAGAEYETAGALGNGEKVFISMAMPEGLQVAGQDTVGWYIGALNAHNASMPFTVVVTPVRWECQNMINFSLSMAKNRFTVRHSGAGLKGQVAEAHRILGLVYKYQEAFEAEAQALIDTTMYQNQFEEMVSAAWGPRPESNTAAQERAEARVDEMLRLFTEKGNTVDAIADTAWAGFNAITEYFDWFSEVRAEDPEARRAEKSLDGAWADQALTVVKDYVGV